MRHFCPIALFMVPVLGCLPDLSSLLCVLDPSECDSVPDTQPGDAEFPPDSQPADGTWQDDGTWTGSFTGQDSVETDGGIPEIISREVMIDVAFSQGQLIEVNTFGPYSVFPWSTEPAAVQGPGDSANLEIITHSAVFRTLAVLKSLELHANRAKLVLDLSYKMMNPGNTFDGIGRIEMELTPMGDDMSCDVRAEYDYTRGVRSGSPFPSDPVQIHDVFAAFGPLTRDHSLIQRAE